MRIDNHIHTSALCGMPHPSHTCRVFRGVIDAVGTVLVTVAHKVCVVEADLRLVQLTAKDIAHIQEILCS